MDSGPSHVSRFSAGLAVLSAAFVLLLALTRESYVAYERNNALTLHTEEVEGALQSLRGDLYRSESAIRAYYLSERAVHLERSREATSAVAQRLEQIRHLTRDNPRQQARVVLLREAVERIMSTRDRLVAFMARDGAAQVKNEFANAAPSLHEADALIGAMDADERLLFVDRRGAAEQDARNVMLAASVLLLAAGLGLFLLAHRVLRELRNRSSSESLLRDAARYAVAHQKVLAHFNANRDRHEVLKGVLAILAQELSMPLSAFFASSPFSEELVLETSHGASADLAKSFHVGEGFVGSAAAVEGARVLETTDATYAFDVGLAKIAPRAVIACAVRTGDRSFGVLVIASTDGTWKDRLEQVERLCAQLAIALENLESIDRQVLLGEQLAARGEEIGRKNAELEHANQLKSEFLATMSHELRTPLNAIIGFSESLRDEMVGPLLPEQKEFLGIVFDSGQHLLALINDVLDLSKIEAGHMDVEPERIEPKALVESSLSVVKERAMRGRVELTSRIASGLPSFVGDARKIKQIVYNLLSNAVKFTPERGKVSLYIGPLTGPELDAKHLQLTRPLRGTSADAYVEIRVTDTGIGIAESDRDRLFRPFIQLENALTRRHGGTGLGLALVDKLAHLHDGAVAMSSTLGEGSTFTVVIPLRSLADAPGAVDVRTHPLGARTARSALVVEDDLSAQLLFREQLESAGIAVTMASTAEEGLEIAMGNAPDVIILDLLLPGMDGFGFLEALHREPSLSRIPVVIASVIADQNRGISLGAFRILQKPVAKEILLEAIEGLSRVTSRAGRVLVVDDDPQALKLVAGQLEQRFSEVLRAYSGDEAIAIASDRRPDVIVLDLMMPDRSGFEVVEILKSRPETAQIPIAILTAKSLTPAERAKLSRHVEVIMQKSEFNHGRFLNEVRRALFSARSQG